MNWCQQKSNCRAVRHKRRRCDLSPCIDASGTTVQQGGTDGYEIVEINHDAVLPDEINKVAVGSVTIAEDLAGLVVPQCLAKCAAGQCAEILQPAAGPEVCVSITRRIVRGSDDLATVVDVEPLAEKISRETTEIQYRVVFPFGVQRTE